MLLFGEFGVSAIKKWRISEPFWGVSMMQSQAALQSATGKVSQTLKKNLSASFDGFACIYGSLTSQALLRPILRKSIYPIHY